MAVRVSVKPELLRWAIARAQLNPENLVTRFSKLPDWEAGRVKPTIRQIKEFALAVRVPVGYLFLAEPPEENIPIPDMRTLGNRKIRHPSPDLIDTIHACQEMQDWYRDFSLIEKQLPRDFIGSVTMRTSPETAARRMEKTLGFTMTARRQCPTWSDALRLFIHQADEIGVLVMVSGIAGSNSRRRLDPDEFRGFALSDPQAPLVFVNGADSKAAQMFTLAHELAHLWLGKSALSDVDARPEPRQEEWCNAVAAELLVPLAELSAQLSTREKIDQAMPRLARVFKVSTLVILRRLLAAGRVGPSQFDSIWHAESSRLRKINRSGDGNFHLTARARVGNRFSQALVSSTLEGQTLYRDACRMLGMSKVSTFNSFARKIGVVQ